jgi:acetyl-CoA synthetase
VAVIDKDGEELPPGETGEVALKDPEDDPIWFKRYLDKPEKTAEIKLDDWHLTEDLAKKDEEGYFWYQSRKDDVIISSGYRISPAVVEDELMQHPDVAEAAVIGIPDDIRGEIVKAYIKCTEDANTNDSLIEELQQFVKNNLAKHEYPREIEFITDFPKTNSGKIRRKELRERN